MNLLSKCILSDYTSYEQFERRLFNEYEISLSPDTAAIARNLFNQLLDLHYAGRDGFWPIILKNSFAPLFCENQFDYIIGNPPWIAWKAMSQSYRDLTLDIWLSYGIFEKSAYDKITSHDDFAMAVTYVAIDHYLKDNGTAALILPQTFVKSLKGGEGFRKFCITRDGQELPFCIDAVYDMLRVNPFKGIASNKTSVYVFKKSTKMVYPMDNYFEYIIRPGQKLDYLTPYEIAKNELGFVQLSAKPINDDIRSPWLTIPLEVTHHIKNFLGTSPYKGRKGIEPCGAKGVYLLEVKGKKDGLLKIANLINRSRLQEAKDLGVHIGYVEEDHIYPMVGGRNIEKWGINSTSICLFLTIITEKAYIEVSLLKSCKQTFTVRTIGCFISTIFYEIHVFVLGNFSTSTNSRGTGLTMLGNIHLCLIKFYGKNKPKHLTAVSYHLYLMTLSLTKLLLQIQRCYLSLLQQKMRHIIYVVFSIQKL